MSLTTGEHKEIIGVLQQKEVDLRTRVSELHSDPMNDPKNEVEYYPDMIARWVEEVEGEADRIRELWTKMERG